MPGETPDRLTSHTRLQGGGRSGTRRAARDELLIDGLEHFELADYKQIDRQKALALRDAHQADKKAQKIKRLDHEDDMKFSHSIQFNAVPDWSSHYIAYSNLKKLYVTNQTITYNAPQVPSC